MLGVARLFVWAGLALWNRRGKPGNRRCPAPAETFRVSVLIPAFNEEKVIVATTVERILASDYPESGSAGDR